jgi:hypothetical protein
LKCSNLIVVHEACNADNQGNPSDRLFTAVPLQLVPNAFFYPPTIRWQCPALRDIDLRVEHVRDWLAQQEQPRKPVASVTR